MSIISNQTHDGDLFPLTEEGGIAPTNRNIGNTALNYLQYALEKLYGGDKMVSCEGKLYRWAVTHYEHLPEEEEKRKIWKYCNEYRTKNKDGIPTCPLAKPRKVNEIWEWVLHSCSRSPENLKTTGVNFTNGVLELDWSSGTPVPILEPHDPDQHFFLAPPSIEYDPNADPTECDRLLECLDRESREILMRTLGASLDLPEVRKRKGRQVKALFCIGGGSNGKDTIRETLSCIYGGVGMTGKSLDDFISYDNGRKFTLSALFGGRVNWASESGKTTKLDNSPSLKAFITGDPIECERKGQDSFTFTPVSAALFNQNELPNIIGTGQAAADRFAPLMFRKTYMTPSKYDPANPSHVLADPRFKDDPDSIQKRVAPAFVNRMVRGLQDLIAEGIDYSPTEEAMDEIRRENNHLFEFASDTGLTYMGGDARTPVDVIWVKLQEWYRERRIMTEDSYGKRIWTDPVRPSDSYVRADRLVAPRIQQLFPNSKKVVDLDRSNGKKKKVTYMSGIAFQPDPLAEVPQNIFPDFDPNPVTYDFDMDTSLQSP